MKNSATLGALFSLSLMMACAPVASSVPKTKAQVVDDRLLDSRDALKASSVELKTEIVTAEEYEAYEKKLSPEYKIIEKFHENDPEIAELIQTRGVKGVVLPVNAKRVDLLVVFVVKGEKTASMKSSKVEGELFRGVDSPEKFSVAILKGKKSDAPWSDVKKNLTQVMIAYRQPITE